MWVEKGAHKDFALGTKATQCWNNWGIIDGSLGNKQYVYSMCALLSLFFTRNADKEDWEGDHCNWQKSEGNADGLINLQAKVHFYTQNFWLIFILVIR